MPTDPGSTPPGAGPHHPDDPSGVPATPELWSAIESLSAAGARPARLSHLLATLSAQAARVFRASALVALPDAGGALVVRRGEGVLADCEGEALPGDGSLAGAAAAAVRPRLSAALAADPARPAEAAWAAGPALAFPLPAESVAEGVVVVVRAPGEPPFTPADAAAAALLGGVVGAFLAAGRRYGEARKRPAAARAAARPAAPDPLVEAALRVAEATAFAVDPVSGALRWSANAPDVLGVPEAELGATLEAWGAHLEGGAETVARMIRDTAEPLSLHLVHRGGDGRATLLLLRTHPAPGVNGAAPQLVCTLQVSGREPGAGTSAGAGAGEGVLPMPSVARALRHEINNSLGVIEAALQLVSREAAPMERATHYELINTGADRLRGLVSRLAQLERDEGASAYVRDDGALGIR
jgi:hypothetical protein